MGLLRGSYSHQCPLINEADYEQPPLVSGGLPRFDGGPGDPMTETENGSDRNPKTRQPFGGDDGFHPNHSLRL